MKLGTEIGLDPGHTVLDGGLPMFGPCPLWKLDKEIGFGPGRIVLDGDPAPPKGHNPRFSAYVRRGQMTGWIKMPLGTEVA